MSDELNKEQSNFDFIVCDSCNGKGFIQNEKCPQCGGMAVVLPFYGRFLYWGKKIDRINIVVDKFIIFVKKIVNLTLFLFSLSGFFVLLYVAYKSNFELLFTWNYWITASPEKSYFWITMISNLYLYYRLAMEGSPEVRVMRRIFLKEPEKPQAMTWEFIRKQSRKKLVDVSKAFEQEAINMVDQSWQLARHFDHNEMKRVHLFASLPSHNTGAIIWGRLGINIELFKEKMARVMNWHLDQKSTHTDLSLEIYKVFIVAYMEAYEENKVKVTVPDLVLALVDDSLLTEDEKRDDYIEKVLIDFELNYQKMFNVIQWIRLQHKMREGLQKFRSLAKYKPKSGLDRAMTAIATPYLDQFSEDVTQAARQGYLFPCIGREKEFEHIYRVLEGSKDGVVLVGNVGVGRSTIIEGLAQRMVEESVPEILQDKRLVRISVSNLIAGATPAEAEERLLVIANEVASSRNIVVVIEEIHHLVGLSNEGGGTMDLSEVLVELLKKKLFLVLATTTEREYSNVIEKSSLKDVLQTVKIDELEINEAIQVLEAKSGAIEYKNAVYFSYDAIDKSATLSSKYIHDKYLPEKALDIMEEVAVMVRKEKGDQAVVTSEDVAHVVASMTGVKVTKVTESETEKLLNLEEDIHNRVVGQDEAVKMVSSSLRRARAELRDDKRPITNMLFLGPTGVGKTELAKTVAEVYFGDEEKMQRFDMSEYQEQSSITRLIGTGDELGVLTEAVRKNPFSLILFDEIEKAHPDILNIFLQVMDDGRLTDGAGNTIDFTNAIIIMTSNAGAEVIQDGIQAGTTIEKIKDRLINEELKKYYRPEFLNRFDGIIVFKPLTMKEVIAIARILAGKVVQRLETKEIYLNISDAAVAELAELGYDPKFGARPLRRVIQERVDDLLANALLKGEIERRDKVVLEPGGELKVDKAEKL